MRETSHKGKALPVSGWLSVISDFIPQERWLGLLKKTIALLGETGTLPPYYQAHKLSGTYPGFWECHIQNDWLMIWEQDDEEITLVLTDTGTHSDLF